MAAWARRRGDSCPYAMGSTGREPSKPFDQTSIDQEPIEATRFRPARAGVEQSLAAIENEFLLGKRRIKRQPGCLLNDKWQIGSLDRVERRGEIDGFEVDCVNRVVGREITRVVNHEVLVDGGLVQRRIENEGGELRLVVAIAHQEE